MSDGIKKINEWIMKDGRTLIVTKAIDANKLEGGTQFIDPATGSLKYLNISNTAVKSWVKYNPMTIFEMGSIQTNLIANLNVTTEKLANSSVATEKLANSSVTTEKLAYGSVSTSKIIDLNVTEIKIANNAVTTNKILNSAITLSKLAENSVNSEKIVSNSIINSNIANQTINATKIFPKTLTNEQIANNTIITELLNTSSVTTDKIANGAVTNMKIAAGNISTGHISDKAIGARQIADNCITTTQINSINGSKLVPLSITEAHLGLNSVTESKIKDGSCTYNKLNTSLKDIINRSIRVETTQTIGAATSPNTAWIKGNVVIKQPTSGNANLDVYGNIDAHNGTVTASKCYNPVFADLCEAYIPTEHFEPGEPLALSLEGNLKVEKLNENNFNRFIGFTSNEYATCYGASQEEILSGEKVAVTLIGRIKIKMPIDTQAKIGEYIYISSEGINTSAEIHSYNVGKLLENKVIGQEYALCQLWPS